MMTPRKRATLIVLIVIAFIALLIFLLSLLFRHPKPSAQPVAQPAATEQSPATPTITSQIYKQEQETRNGSSDVIAFSKMFTERYGSYSNQANFQNIRDVIPLMSASFGSKTESDLKNKKAPDTFYGVTTRVITVKVVKSDEKAGTATVDLTTQQEEEIGSAQNTSVKYQDIELTFVKESGVWKVDSATWR